MCRTHSTFTTLSIVPNRNDFVGVQLLEENKDLFSAWRILMKINFDDLSLEKMSELINDLIDNKKDFDITGLKKETLNDAVKLVEKIIESKGLSCRVYTAGRIATAALMVPPFTALGVAAMASIATHNAVIKNPDYTIAKHRVRKMLKVKYCKIS